MLQTIARRYGGGRVTPLPMVGMFNAVFLLGDDLVLRVPRDHPDFIAAAQRESIAAPAALSVGVRTPRLIALDDTQELLPVPYLVYARVQGVSLESLDLDPLRTTDVWRELGRDLARLHGADFAAGPVTSLLAEDLDDPRTLVDGLTSGGQITSREARWFDRWLAQLAPVVEMPVTPCLIHGDVQIANLMVDPATATYRALIDWGGAAWSDPAYDFAGFPLRAVPLVLDGYRAAAPVAAETVAPARILWRHLQLALWLLARPGQPDRSWAERPATMILDLLRFFLSDPPQEWKALAPPKDAD